MLYSPLPESLTVRPSSIHGLGLFAISDIEVGTNLGIAHMKMVEWLKFPQDHCRTPLGGFYNHSDDPNCQLVGDEVKRLVTIKKVLLTEQLMYYDKWVLV